MPRGDRRGPRRNYDAVSDGTDKQFIETYFNNDRVAIAEARRQFQTQQDRFRRAPTGRTPSVVVFGAGVAGLSAAHELIERGFQVQVVEQTQSLDNEYECEVGGMARNQQVRVRETQRIHPYAFYGHLDSPYRNADFPETFEWDRPPEGYLHTGQYSWRPIWQRDPRAELHNVIRRQLSEMRKLTYRRATPRVGLPERIHFRRNSSKFEAEFKDVYGKTNRRKLSSLCDRILKAYVAYAKELVADLAETPYKLSDLDPEMRLRETMLIEVRGYCEDAVAPLRREHLAWERGNAVKEAIGIEIRNRIFSQLPDGSSTGPKRRSYRPTHARNPDYEEYQNFIGDIWKEIEPLVAGVEAREDKEILPDADWLNPHYFIENHLVVRVMQPTGVPGDENVRDDRRLGDRVELRMIEHELPAEHGYRFFPSFYRHLFDLMQRTPILDDDDTETSETVYHMLKTPPPVAVGAENGKAPESAAREKPESLEDVRKSMEFMFNELDITPRDGLRTAIQLLKFVTSSDSRRRLYENMSWLQFIDGQSEHSSSPTWEEAQDIRTNYSKRAEALINDLPQALIAMAAEETDATTYGVVSTQLFADYSGDGDQTDMTLRGPTSHAWLYPWKRYLKAQGVQFFIGQLDHLEEQDDGYELVPIVRGPTSNPREAVPEDSRDKLLQFAAPGQPFIVKAQNAKSERIIDRKFVRVGDRVNAGDALFAYEPSDDSRRRFDAVPSPYEGVVKSVQIAKGDVASDGDTACIIKCTDNVIRAVLLDGIGTNRTIANVDIAENDDISLGGTLVKFAPLRSSYDLEKFPTKEAKFFVKYGDTVSDGDRFARHDGKDYVFENIGTNRVILTVDRNKEQQVNGISDLYIKLAHPTDVELATQTGELRSWHIKPKRGKTVKPGKNLATIFTDDVVSAPDFYVMALPYEQSVEALRRSQRKSRIDLSTRIQNYLAADFQDLEEAHAIAVALLFAYSFDERLTRNRLKEEQNKFAAQDPQRRARGARIKELRRARRKLVFAKWPKSSELLKQCSEMLRNPLQFSGDLKTLIDFDDRISHRHNLDHIPVDREIYEPPFHMARDDFGKPQARFTNPLRDFFGVQYYFSGQVRLGDGHLTFPDSKWGVSSISQIFQWRKRPSRKQGFLGQLSVDIGDAYRMDMRSEKSAFQSTPDEIARTTWQQILDGTDSAYQRHVSEPTSYHIDNYLDFDTPPPRNGHQHPMNRSPYFICLPGQWAHKPGLRRGELGNHHATPEAPEEHNDIYYRPSHDRWFLAGSYMPTTTRLTTMESACESARHAVNGILHQLLGDSEDSYVGSGMLVGEFAQIFDPGQHEFSALDPLKRLDAELMKEGLPHFLDILGVLEYCDSVTSGSDPQNNPLGNLLKLNQQVQSTIAKDWEPQLRSLVGTYTGNIDNLIDIVRTIAKEASAFIESSTKRTDE